MDQKIFVFDASVKSPGKPEHTLLQFESDAAQVSTLKSFGLELQATILGCAGRNLIGSLGCICLSVLTSRGSKSL